MDQRGQRVDSRMTCEYVPSWNFLLAEIMWNSFLHNNIVQSENNKEQLHPKSPTAWRSGLQGEKGVFDSLQA